MKKALTLTLALVFATVSNYALAASANCTVTAVDKDGITLDCGTKTNAFKIDDKVKIKTAKTKKAIEGC